MLNVTDLSSIESRVLGWIADCKGINDAFAQGKDTYKIFATYMYNVAYEDVIKKQRNLSKPPVLGGGYRLSGKGLVGYAAGMGIEVTEEEANEMIRIFREVLYPEIPVFWRWCKDAVFHTTSTGGTFKGPHGLQTEAFGEFLFIRLPSGRKIAYHLPKIEVREAPWYEVEPILDDQGNVLVPGVKAKVPQFTFMGRCKFTTKWTRIAAHDGYITENIVQAIARDILALWMKRADEAGYNLIGHVHDEIIVEEDRNVINELNELIRQPIPWAPGLLLDAEGFIAKRYKKG